jgi:hypothetical protein
MIEVFRTENPPFQGEVFYTIISEDTGSIVIDTEAGTIDLSRVAGIFGSGEVAGIVGGGDFPRTAMVTVMPHDIGRRLYRMRAGGSYIWQAESDPDRAARIAAG